MDGDEVVLTENKWVIDKWYIMRYDTDVNQFQLCLKDLP
jgi:hypothetical protein